MGEEQNSDVDTIKLFIPFINFCGRQVLLVSADDEVLASPCGGRTSIGHSGALSPYLYIMTAHFTLTHAAKP